MVWQEDGIDAELFFRLSLDMLCVLGFDGYYKKLNPAWEKTLGYAINELKERPYVDFVHPDDRVMTIAEVQKLTAANQKFPSRIAICAETARTNGFCGTLCPYQNDN